MYLHEYIDCSIDGGPSILTNRQFEAYLRYMILWRYQETHIRPQYEAPAEKPIWGWPKSLARMKTGIKDHPSSASFPNPKPLPSLRLWKKRRRTGSSRVTAGNILMTITTAIIGRIRNRPIYRYTYMSEYICIYLCILCKYT